MTVTWILQSFYRSLIPQLYELERVSGGILPDAIWVLGPSDTALPVYEKTSVRLLVCDSGEQECWLALLSAAHACAPAQCYLLPSDEEGVGLAVRLAHRLGGSALTEISRLTISSGKGDVLAYRPCYDGHMEAGFKMERPPYCLSAGRCVQTDVPESLLHPAMEEQLWRIPVCQEESRVKTEVRPCVREDGLSTAQRVVAVGRGAVHSKESMEQCRRLAQLMDASLGASRPVVMDGYAPMEALLGASGSLVGPHVCLVLGASGSSAFLAGVENSGRILAVNRDQHASMLKQADLAAVADCDELIPAMLEILEGKNRE